VDELLDEELLELLDPDDEEPMFGQLWLLYVEPDPLELDDVVVVGDCANEANPIASAAIAMMAMIVIISKLRLLGRNNPAVLLEVELIDKFCFSPRLQARKKLVKLISNFQDAS
jgi:hypothetical protein